ncbi:MAG: glycosyltransferase family 4 protein [Chloroflexota bacterium]|nr:glycosyltransferase family 4 protein [Chloroflexota bacterium]
MRILMLSWEYDPHIIGGMGKHVTELLPSLVKQDVTVDLVTPLYPHTEMVERDGGLSIHRVALPPRTAAGFSEGVRGANETIKEACDSIIEREGTFDLIHNHDWLTSFAAIQLKHEHRIPLLATVHATERGRGRGELVGPDAQEINDAEWRLTFEAWRVICCTHYMAQELQDYFSTPLDKIEVIPNGIDPEPLSRLASQDLGDFRAQYAGPEERLVFSVGRIVYEKGMETLVRAVPQVLARFPQTKFVIAGKGPELEKLRGLVRQMHLEESVSLPGFISDADRDRLYCVSDCAVFPSLYEPFGIVALEAMAARTPVVVSEVGGLREVVEHGETGITIWPNDVDSCAWGILHTLEHPDWAQRRVENAYQKVLSVYDWARIAEQTKGVYERVIEERAHTNW